MKSTIHACWSPGPVLLSAKDKEASFSVCSGVDGCRLITENEILWRLVWQPSPLTKKGKRNSPPVQTESYWRKSLKFMIKILKYSSSQLIPSGDCVKKDTVIFNGLTTGSLTVLQWVYGQHKQDLLVFLLHFLVFVNFLG